MALAVALAIGGGWFALRLSAPPAPRALDTGLSPAASEKLDSAFHEVLDAYRRGGETAALTQARIRGIYGADGSIRLVVIVPEARSIEIERSLESLGVRVEASSGGRITIAAPIAAFRQGGSPSAAEALAAFPDVIAIEAPRAPARYAAGGPSRSSPPM